ncbi:hypothetical protein KQX54_000295 [Cotesia glomerata]|uniref:Uncharacterized protein n=1 Tax=Cotesia glomerata TaxID=32391 RepID=A0AAV7IBT4_COTGL|nr:hypothetical protein KQX54_000295 [Cotesia glomerata]
MPSDSDSDRSNKYRKSIIDDPDRAVQIHLTALQIINDLQNILNLDVDIDLAQEAVTILDLKVVTDLLQEVLKVKTNGDIKIDEDPSRYHLCDQIVERYDHHLGKKKSVNIPIKDEFTIEPRIKESILEEINADSDNVKVPIVSNPSVVSESIFHSSILMDQTVHLTNG